MEDLILQFPYVSLVVSAVLGVLLQKKYDIYTKVMEKLK